MSIIVHKIEFNVDSFNYLNEFRDEEGAPRYSREQIETGCVAAKALLEGSDSRIMQEFFEYVLEIAEECIADTSPE